MIHMYEYKESGRLNLYFFSFFFFLGGGGEEFYKKNIDRTGLHHKNIQGGSQEENKSRPY